MSGDGGPALAATLNGPKHLCLDRDGTVLIADAENHVIRRYDPKAGLITRVAGTGKPGVAGLGGDPLQWELRRPHGVTIAPDGALYITDSYNDRVLKVCVRRSARSGLRTLHGGRAGRGRRWDRGFPRRLSVGRSGTGLDAIRGRSRP